MQDHDDWISASTFLPPVSPTGLSMRDAFDADVYVQDAYLHDQWQRVLHAVAPPPWFEAGPPAVGARWPIAAVAPPAPAARRLTDDVPPLEDDAQQRAVAPAPTARCRSPPRHSRSVANFVRDVLLTHNQAGMPPQYFSLGEVAQYFNNFVVDMDNNGPYTSAQLSAMYHVPEVNILKLWSFRPGVQRFTRKQVASRLRMTPTEVSLAYAALGFKAWML